VLQTGWVQKFNVPGRAMSVEANDIDCRTSRGGGGCR
jgi:hypothetical protein